MSGFIVSTPSGAYISITSNRGCSFCGFFCSHSLRGGGQFLPLGKGHKLTRLGECGIFAQLHLCKDHISPVGGDHIQLAEAGNGSSWQRMRQPFFRRYSAASASP